MWGVCDDAIYTHHGANSKSPCNGFNFIDITHKFLSDCRI